MPRRRPIASVADLVLPVSFCTVRPSVGSSRRRRRCPVASVLTPQVDVVPRSLVCRRRAVTVRHRSSHCTTRAGVPVAPSMMSNRLSHTTRPSLQPISATNRNVDGSSAEVVVQTAASPIMPSAMPIRRRILDALSTPVEHLQRCPLVVCLTSRLTLALSTSSLLSTSACRRRSRRPTAPRLSATR